MKLIKTIEPDFKFTDQRGSLTQLVHTGYKQINVLYSKSGVVRGGHFHKMSTEAFYVVSGSVELTAYNTTDKEKYLFSQGAFFKINPYTVHSMYFPMDCILIAMYDQRIELADGTKDIYPEEEY